VTPDLAVFAKALAGGFPIGAVVGRRAIMQRAADGSVLHGGSFNGHTASMAAGLATLAELSRPGVYEQMEARGETLMAGLRRAAERAGIQLLVQGLGTVFNTAFAVGGQVTDYRSFQRNTDSGQLRRFLHALQEHGVRPTSRGTWFLSTAHTDADIEETIGSAEAALSSLSA
jgi:glutamate-1-semialdehyde 2,1-aminomutase